MADTRWRRLAGLHRGPRLHLLRTGNDVQVRRRGESPRFAGAPLVVPTETLRARPGDVLTPAELAHRHAADRHRVCMGPSYRADMWAALEQDPNLSAAELARRTYGSFSTAWTAKRDHGVLHAEA